MGDIERVHVLYSGDVQGVGFRFTAERIALKLGLTGFVRNLPDGGVELVSEGDRRKLEAFLEELNDDMKGYISDSDVRWEKAREDFRGFGISF